MSCGWSDPGPHVVMTRNDVDKLSESQECVLEMRAEGDKSGTAEAEGRGGRDVRGRCLENSHWPKVTQPSR